MQNNTANLNIMIKAARKASKSLIRDFNEIEKLIDTLLNENFAGDYTEAADELSKALRHVIEVRLLINYD